MAHVAAPGARTKISPETTSPCRNGSLFLTDSSGGFRLLTTIELARGGICRRCCPARSRPAAKPDEKAAEVGVADRIDARALDVRKLLDIAVVVDIVARDYGRSDMLINYAGFAEDIKL